MSDHECVCTICHDFGLSPAPLHPLHVGLRFSSAVSINGVMYNVERIQVYLDGVATSAVEAYPHPTEGFIVRYRPPSHRCGTCMPRYKAAVDAIGPEPDRDKAFDKHLEWSRAVYAAKKAGQIPAVGVCMEVVKGNVIITVDSPLKGKMTYVIS